MADIPALWLYRSDADGATVGPVELGVLAAAWAAGDIDGLTPVAAAPDARDAAVPLPVFQPLSSVPPLRAALAAIPVAGEEVDADEFGTASAEASMAAAGGVGLAEGGDAWAGPEWEPALHAPKGQAVGGGWPPPPDDVTTDPLVVDEPAYDEEVYAPSPPPPLPPYTDTEAQGDGGATMDATTAALVGMDTPASADDAAAAAGAGPPAATGAGDATTGGGDPPAGEAAATTEEARLAKARKRARARANRAARAATAHTLYWSGAPPDVTAAEVVAFFAVCGVLATGADGSPRVKCYGTGGDGLVTYALGPSVENALRVLDGGEVRQGWRLKVERATLRPKEGGTGGRGAPSTAGAVGADAAGAAGPSVAKRPRVDGGGGGDGGGRGGKGGRGAPPRRRGQVPTAVSWADDAEEGAAAAGPNKSERRILILTNVFDAAEAAAAGDVAAVGAWYGALHDEMVAGATAEAPVEKVTVFERSPVGAVAVKFRTGAGAAAALGVMDGRWFGGRRLAAAWWDGQDYRVAEGADEAAQRGQSWAAWLEGGEGAGGGGGGGGKEAAPADAQASAEARDEGGGGVENGDGAFDVAARASDGGAGVHIGTPAQG